MARTKFEPETDGDSAEAVPRPQEVRSAADIQTALEQREVRTAYRFGIPSSLVQRQRKDAARVIVTDIAIKLVTDRDEADAAERAGSSSRLPAELSKAALVKVNGQRVSLGDGSTDTVYAAMHPAVRSLLVQAYTKLHYPEGAEADSFLGSCEPETF